MGKDHNLATYLASEQGNPPPGGCLAPILARKISGKIKDALGFDRCHTFCTGAAPIARDIMKKLLELQPPFAQAGLEAPATDPIQADPA